MRQLFASDILESFDKTFPRAWIDGLKAGQGYEILQAIAGVMERVSAAAQRLDTGLSSVGSEGGARSNGFVQFSRPSATAGAVTVKAGTVVSTSVNGRRFRTTEDAVLGALDLGPISAGVIAVLDSWQNNVPGAVTTAGGETIAGAVDTIDTLILDPAYGDPTIVVTNLAEIKDGRAPMLDAIGGDLDIIRYPGETDAAYRLRIRSLPDTVSPAAIQRAVDAFFRRYNETATVVELWDVTFQTCWNAPSTNASDPDYTPIASPNPNYDEALFAWNHPDVEFRGRWLDTLTESGCFVVVVPAMQPFEDWSFVWSDDTALTPADFTSPTTNGRRGYGAWDLPDTFPEIQGVWDGEDYAGALFIGQLWDLLQKIKAAGVTALLDLEGQ